MTLTVRIERDSLGEIQVPAGALYGAQTQRAVENFPISGLRPWRAFIWSMATIKRAAAEVNLGLGLLDGERAGAIQEAALEVVEGKWDDQFVVDPFQAGAGTSHNMNVNEVIANRATQLLGGGLGEYRVHPNDHVNMAQSTNDVIPTALRLGCLWRLDELLGVLNDLRSALQAKAVEFDDVVKSGRTHLQDAVPVRLGQEFGAYAKAVERDAARIQRSAEGLRRLGIGGTAVGSGLNAHPEYHARMVKKLSELTGLQLYEFRQPVRIDAVHGGCSGFLGLPAHAGADPDPDRKRLPPAGLGSLDRAGRAPSTGGPTRFKHHAGQGQPGHG